MLKREECTNSIEELIMSEDKFIPKKQTRGRGRYVRKVAVGDDAIEDALPQLTPKQQKFVNNVLAGMHHKDAYKDAYGTTEAKESTISVEASRLLRNPRVQEWLGAAKRLSLVSGAMTFDRWLADMQAYIQCAVEEKALGTAIKGHEIVGKSLGFVDRKDDKQNNNLDGERLFQVLSQLLPPILGTVLWRQVEERLAPYLIGGEVQSVRMIEGTSYAVKE